MYHRICFHNQGQLFLLETLLLQVQRDFISNWVWRSCCTCSRSTTSRVSMSRPDLLMKGPHLHAQMHDSTVRKIAWKIIARNINGPANMRKVSVSVSTTKYRNNAPNVNPSIVISKLTNVHLVEQTRYFLFPIFSTEKVKIENMGIKAYEGHLVRMVRVFLHPQ